MPQIKFLLYLGCCVLLLILPKKILAQDASFFKIWPAIEDNDPEWVKEMYKPIPNIFKVIELYEDFYSQHPFKKTVHTQNYKHWLIEVRYLADEDGFVYSNARRKYNEKLKRVKTLKARKAQIGKKKTLSLNAGKSTLWSNIGPSQTYLNKDGSELSIAQANIYTISVAPSNSSFLYAGTETGGIFRSKDKGLHWDLIAKDGTFNPKIIDITIHPTDTETIDFSSRDNNVYKSSDGGSTHNLKEIRNKI